nr:beta family protein [Aestuariivirga sp. YIM B02566]
MLSDQMPCRYVPILAIRPAEMKALEELPEVDKDSMLPLILIRPWLSANTLSKSINRFKEAYGETRPWLADIDPFYAAALANDDDDDDEADPKKVFSEIEALQDPANGYSNWCAFIEADPRAIPCLRLDPNNINALTQEIITFSAMQRGICLRIPRAGFGGIGQIADILNAQNVTSVLFILDFEQATMNELSNAAAAIGLINTIKGKIPGAEIAISATTFPDSFNGLKEQAIAERGFFSLIKAQLGQFRLIYSDRGSARAEKRTGGGGLPPPRVDYPSFKNWYFFKPEKIPTYQAAAKAAMTHKSWEPKMKIWGTQMIERTAKGDPYAIVSPVRSTATRINLHLHHQLYFDDPPLALQEIEDDWVD